MRLGGRIVVEGDGLDHHKIAPVDLLGGQRLLGGLLLLAFFLFLLATELHAVDGCAQRCFAMLVDVEERVLDGRVEVDDFCVLVDVGKENTVQNVRRLEEAELRIQALIVLDSVQKLED